MARKHSWINGFKWKLIYLHPKDERLDDGDGAAVMSDRELIISKNPSAVYYTQEKVIDHESLHAQFYERGIRDLDDHLEHVIIEAVVDYIYDNYHGGKGNVRRRRR